MNKGHIVCRTTTIKFRVIAVNFVIDVPHKSGLHIARGASLHLQKLLYFPQVKLASQQPVCLMQYFSFPVFYLVFNLFFYLFFISAALLLSTLDFHFLSYMQLRF